MTGSQKIQHRQYEFPYHHIPFIDERGEGKRIRTLNWGFEYLLCMRRVSELITAENPSSVLDVGCGDGYLLGHLPDRIPVRRGIDINDQALAYARAFFPQVDYRNEEVAGITETFDVVCLIEVLEHIPDAETDGFLRATAKRVKLGGTLLITVPTTNIPLNPKHFRHYDRELLAAQIGRAIPDMVVEGIEYYYIFTRTERFYRAMTQSLLVQGEIPLLRGLIWRHARRQAGKATATNGHHLIARLTRQ